MNDSLSIFARALATENLSFSFDPTAETAAFDVKNRHLVMPVWDVSETVQTMLIAHEISHALWTPYEQSEKLLDEAERQGYDKRILHRIANVVEDVRIEKLMKEKFPGTRRDFYLGYKEIVDRDMFKLHKIDWSKADLVQRMNAHFKWGSPGFITLPLSDAEQKIAAAIDRVQTFDQTIAVAKILYDHPAMQDAIQKAKQPKQSGEAEGGNEPGPEVPGDLSSAISKKDGENYTATTVTINAIKNLSDQIISTECLLRLYESREGSPLNMENYRKFVRQSDAFVRQLVAQFERRKAADEIRKERPKQTGALNLDRLHQYRTHDDIFLSKIIKPEGKNHGIVFLIDCSGSMDKVFGDCILQVLQLVWFCEKAKIPFEVFGFTDCHHPDWKAKSEKAAEEYLKANPQDPNLRNFRYRDNPEAINPKMTSINYGHTKLIQFASSRDKADARERLLAFLYESCVQGARYREFHLGGTPTVEAVSYATQFVKDWVEANNIQIPTLMVVTDGEPNGIHFNDPTGNLNNPRIYRTYECNSLTVCNEILGTVIRFPTANHPGLDLSNAIIGTMLLSLRTALNARCVGMFVGPKTFGESLFQRFCITRREYANDPQIWSRTNSTSPRYEAAKEMYEDGALLLPQEMYPGYDAFFLVKTPKIVDDADAIADKGNFTKVKNTFVKTMGKRGCSRVFLSKYVDIVAGQPLRKEDETLYKKPV